MFYAPLQVLDLILESLHRARPRGRDASPAPRRGPVPPKDCHAHLKTAKGRYTVAITRFGPYLRILTVFFYNIFARDRYVYSGCT